MGWDITDFGSGDFKKIGLSLITLRNGNPNEVSSFNLKCKLEELKY